MAKKKLKKLPQGLRNTKSPSYIYNCCYVKHKLNTLLHFSCQCGVWSFTEKRFLISQTNNHVFCRQLVKTLPVPSFEPARSQEANFTVKPIKLLLKCLNVYLDD